MGAARSIISFWYSIAVRGCWELDAHTRSIGLRQYLVDSYGEEDRPPPRFPYEHSYLRIRWSLAGQIPYHRRMDGRYDTKWPGNECVPGRDPNLGSSLRWLLPKYSEIGLTREM